MEGCHLPLRFQLQQQAQVSLRLTAQAKQALVEAQAQGIACSMRFAADGTGPQVLTRAHRLLGSSKRMRRTWPEKNKEEWAPGAFLLLPRKHEKL